MTAVAAFDATVIGLRALTLDVPNAGSPALANFVTAHIPSLGAWSAGALTAQVAALRDAGVVEIPPEVAPHLDQHA